MVAQNGNVVKRGKGGENRLRIKQKKTCMVRRNTKVKETLKEGRGRQGGCCFLLCSKLKKRVQRRFHRAWLLLKSKFATAGQLRPDVERILNVFYHN